MNESSPHHPPEFKHAAEMEWEMGRFGKLTKFLFHPRPERRGNQGRGSHPVRRATGGVRQCRRTRELALPEVRRPHARNPCVTKGRNPFSAL
jgi:hypothetical protein